MLSLGAVSVTADEMKDVFSAMPDSVMPTLTRNNRLDMVDFVESGMRAEVKDVFDDTSTLDTLTADYLHLTLSDAVKVEMKLLPSSVALPDSSSQVVCVVMTYGRKPIESSVQLFTSRWNPLPRPAAVTSGEVASLSISSNTLTLREMELVSYREIDEGKNDFLSDSTEKEENKLITLKWNGFMFNKE